MVWLCAGVGAGVVWLWRSRRGWKRRALRVEGVLRQDRQQVAAFEADMMARFAPHCPPLEGVR